MARQRFVKPAVVRLYLADVYRREHQELVDSKKAKPEELAASEARVREAVEDGAFIDVKKRLNTGEHQEYLSRMMPHQTPGEKPMMQTREVMTGKVLSYLLGWSLTDEGQPVRYSPDMPEADRLAILNNLDPDTFREIRVAIDAHEEAEDKARDAEKNGQAGVTSSPAISPSQSITTGPMTMSSI